MCQSAFTFAFHDYGYTTVEIQPWMANCTLESGLGPLSSKISPPRTSRCLRMDL